MRPVGGVETRNGLVLYPYVEIKNQKEYLSCRDTPWRVSVLTLTPSYPSWITVLGREVPIYLAMKMNKLCLWVRQRVAGVSGIPFKGPTDFFTHRLISFGTQFRRSSLKNTRNIQGETELTGFRVGAGGAEVKAALSRYWSTNGHHCSFVESSLSPTSKHKRVPNMNSPLT